MKTQSKWLVSGLISFSLLCASVQADTGESLRGHGLNVGALLGADLISGGSSASTSNLGWGLRVGKHLDPNWELGVGFTTTSNSTTAGGITNSTSLGLLLADLNYHLPAEWNPLYFGIRLGMGFSGGSTTIPNISVDSTTNFAWGFVGGYDFTIGNGFSIGPRVAYTMLNRSNDTNIGDFQIHGALKYFF